MGEAIGASTVDLEWVQVHPTGASPIWEQNRRMDGGFPENFSFFGCSPAKPTTWRLDFEGDPFAPFVVLARLCQINPQGPYAKICSPLRIVDEIDLGLPFVCLAACVSVSVSVRVCLCLSVSVCACLFLSVCPSGRLSVGLPVIVRAFVVCAIVLYYFLSFFFHCF